MNKNNEFVINYLSKYDTELAEKLKKYDREFTTAEMIRLIDISQSPMAEKHEAYRKLILQFPNHILKWKGENIPLPIFLTACIEGENKLIEKFESDEYCYCYQTNSYLSNGKWQSEYLGRESTFATYEEAIDFCKCFHDEKYVMHTIDKVYSHYNQSYISAQFRASDMSMLRIYSMNVLSKEDDYYNSVWLKEVTLCELL